MYLQILVSSSAVLRLTAQSYIGSENDITEDEQHIVWCHVVLAPTVSPLTRQRHFFQTSGVKRETDDETGRAIDTPPGERPTETKLCYSQFGSI